MPIDRTVALLDGYDLGRIRSEIDQTDDFEMTRTQAAGKRIWRDVWLFPLIALALDYGLTSIYVSDVTWDKMLFGTEGIALVFALMAVMGVVSWFLAGSIRISVKQDELTYRGRSYVLSQLSLPHFVPHEVIQLGTRSGAPIRLFDHGSALSRHTAARKREIADRLNAAILLLERRDALRNTASSGTDPFRDGADAGVTR